MRWRGRCWVASASSSGSFCSWRRPCTGFDDRGEGGAKRRRKVPDFAGLPRRRQVQETNRSQDGYSQGTDSVPRSRRGGNERRTTRYEIDSFFRNIGGVSNEEPEELWQRLSSAQSVAACCRLTVARGAN